MKLEPPGVFVVTTQTSVYRIDTDALRAVRSPRTPGASPTVPSATSDDSDQPLRPVVHRPLFTDGAPLVLTEVPEPVVGQPMRLRVLVAEEFLDHASQGRSTEMLTTEVVSVQRVPRA